MTGDRFGRSYFDAEAGNWNPAPFFSPGYVFDSMPDYTDLFTAVSAPVVNPGKDNSATISFFR